MWILTRTCILERELEPKGSEKKKMFEIEYFREKKSITNPSESEYHVYSCRLVIRKRYSIAPCDESRIKTNEISNESRSHNCFMVHENLLGLCLPPSP